MMGRMAGGSPRARARIAGLFEALEGLASAGGQVFILGRLAVPGDAAATAAGILGHERLYWAGFALSLLGVAFHVVWIFLFYGLFKPVNRSVAQLAVLFGLVVCGLQAVTALLYVAPWLVLRGGSGLAALPPDHAQALAYAFLKLNSYAFDVDLVFFGFWCILSGYLIFRSRFLPRVLGVLLVIDGVGWALYMVPPLASRLFPFIAAASGLAEIPLQLWLLVAGVNERRWKEQASAAGESIGP